MTSPKSIPTIAIALNSEGNTAPDWVQLTPSGPEIQGRDGRQWHLPNPEAVVAAFRERGGDLPVDFEHATQIKGAIGEAAPAIGWIKDLEVRDAAIWGQIEWTTEGRNAVASKGYRYVSPVFTFKKVAGDVLAMVSAGLTNLPNLKMAAMNKDGGEQETKKMDKAILTALGLGEDATVAQAVNKIEELKTSEATALNRAGQPDPAKFVPRADYDLALNKVTDLEKVQKDTRDAKITLALDGATEAGKIAPASRAYHEAACREDGGLERFLKFVEETPVLVGKADGDDADLATNKTQLSADEIAICRQLGMTQEDFIAQKSEQE